jgi:DNA-directed RNA polymerase specialized sigma24 family protein
MTGNEDDALDISQEAFIKAYTGLKNSGRKAVFRLAVPAYI